MARPKLSNVSTATLQAELQRRVAKLDALVAQRRKLDEEIGELQAAMGQPAAPAGKAGGKAKLARQPRATKAKVRKRKSYPQTAEQFVTGLAKGKGATTSEINQAWVSAGRVGRADNTLNRMVKAGSLRRDKLQGQKGSRYTLA